MFGPLLLTLLPVADTVSVTGRLVDHAGAPVPNASVELSAAPADPELAATWSPPSSFSGVDGDFSLRFVPPGVPVACRISLANGDQLTTTWHAFEERDLDLGEIRLPATATVTGRIQMPDGEALIEGWSVSLDLESLLPSGLRLRAPRLTHPSPETGEFRIEVPALPVRVTANHTLGLRVSATLEDLPAGSEVHVPLVHRGPVPQRMLRVRLVHPIRRELSPDAVTLTDDAGRRYEGTARGMTIEYQDLPPGLMWVQIADPYYAGGGGPVSTGDTHDFQVTGSGTLRLTVFEETKRATRYGVRVTYFRERGGPQEMLCADGAMAPTRLDGLLPVPMWIEVRPPTGDPVVIPVDGGLANGFGQFDLGDIEVKLPRTFSRRLVFVDEQGRRIVEGELTWVHSGEERTTSGTTKITASGRARLRMAEGTLTLELPGKPSRVATLTWNDELPDPVEVQLAPADR